MRRPDTGAAKGIEALHQDVDELAAAIRSRGGELDQEPQDRPWGTRDFGLVDPDAEEPARIRRSAFDLQPFPPEDARAGTYNRSVSALFVELHRAGFRVDTVLEPAPASPGGPHWTPAMEALPATLILRARKEGI
mgnify:CR=1 FL=1